MDLIDEFVYIFWINYVKIRQSFLHMKILPMKWNEIFYIWLFLLHSELKMVIWHHNKKINCFYIIKKN